MESHATAEPIQGQFLGSTLSHSFSMGVPGTWFREYTGWRSNLHPSKGPFEDKLFQYLIKLSPSPASLKIWHFHLICHGISRRRVETPVGKYFT